jgi:predicted GNAT family acetyltransferase
MSASASDVTVVHNVAKQRFEAVVEGITCVCDYQLDGRVMNMTHTGVAPKLEGRGIAAALVEAAFDHARAHDLRVRPLCSYVAVWARRHPEVDPLLA